MTKEILVIDDNLDIRQLISGILKDKGFVVREAANYSQALLEINKKLPDVAVIDVKLDKGDNDGILLLDHIKNKNPDLPVIMISGHANIEMAIKSLQSGAFEFIEKPFDKDRLINFVNRAVENFRLKKFFPHSYVSYLNLKKRSSQLIKNETKKRDIFCKFSLFIFFLRLNLLRLFRLNPYFHFFQLLVFFAFLFLHEF